MTGRLCAPEPEGRRIYFRVRPPKAERLEIRFPNCSENRVSREVSTV